MYFFASFFLLLACNKENLDAALETRGNDNHKNWKLANASGGWDYTTTDGGSGAGYGVDTYTYGCSRPYGRAIASSSHYEEDGNVLWDIHRTMTYNDNFKVAEESSDETGTEIIRTFNYDSEGKFTGVTTVVDGVALEDEFKFDDQGRVLEYTNEGVKTEYIWKGDNIKEFRIYVQPEEEMALIQKSNAFNFIGYDDKSRTQAKKQVLKSLAFIQKQAKNTYRSKQTEWQLVLIEEIEVDNNIIQPFSSPGAGYPGSIGDGGWLFKTKNFMTKFTDYPINPDGSKGEISYQAHNHTVATKDNLPENVIYSLYIHEIAQDADGNAINWNETGTIHYDYISGCNETSELKSKIK